jgi:putative DNA primase/helicase
MIAPTQANVRSALGFISPDLPREDWVKIGMAVKSSLNGSGLTVFDEWSKGGCNYNEYDTRDTWKSISTDGGVTIGTLFGVALGNGWKPDVEFQESEAERLARELKQKTKTNRELQTKAVKAANAAKKAAALWQSAGSAENHPYLVKKGVQHIEALRALDIAKVTEILGYTPKSNGVQLSGSILIAPVEINGKLSTIEMIDEAGRKSAIAGSAKSGGYWSAQSIPENDSTELYILIGEGVATVLSVRESMNPTPECRIESIPTLNSTPLQASIDAASKYLEALSVGNVGFSEKNQKIFLSSLSAGNMPKVAQAMRERYPSAHIVILADIGNGQDKAEKAATAVNATLVTPQFADDTQGTDFNDLHQHVGLDSVRSQIEMAINVFQKKNISEIKNNPTLPTLSSNDGALNLHQSYTNPTLKSINPTLNPTPSEKPLIKPGVFVFLNADGKPCRVIESKAAKILAELLSIERFAWNSDAAAWHRFDGCCWSQLLSASEPERVVLSAMFEGCEPVGFKQSYFNGVLNIMLRAGLIPLPPEPIGKIPFKNGLFDMKTHRIESITPENAATWAIPHNYHAGNNCLSFMAWIKSATGEDQELIELLRAFINACLTGRSDLQKFLHLLGPGGTGKSTFIRLLFAMLGQSNCVTTDLQQLEQNRFETACLYGKRLAAITDSDKYGGSVNVLKAITGQDPVRNERKHVQQAGTFTYSGMVLIASNEPLASTDYTSGLERRRLVVKFERRIPPEEKAAFIAAGGEAKLQSEIPAIINWALELSNDDVTHLFMHPPKAAVQAGFESLTAQNPIVEWIADNLLPDSNFWSLIGVKKELKGTSGEVLFEDSDTRLYPNYLKWCAENKREALSLRRFRHAALDMMRTMGAEVKDTRRNQGQGIEGVKVRKEYEKLHNWGQV